MKQIVCVSVLLLVGMLSGCQSNESNGKLEQCQRDLADLQSRYEQLRTESEQEIQQLKDSLVMMTEMIQKLEQIQPEGR